MPTVLDIILERKHQEVAVLKAGPDRDGLRRQARNLPPRRNLAAALKQAPCRAVIAEIKRHSPSAGSLRQEVDPAELARAYERGGASAISVLLDKPFFGGSLEDLRAVRGAVNLPLLAKDFIIDPIQIHQAALAGADAVLLIAAALDQDRLQRLFNEVCEMGLTPLVEVHSREELLRVLPLNPPLVGINNRDLATLKVSLETCLLLRPLISPGVTVVAESGIKGPLDIDRLHQAGLHGFLIGTALMKARDPEALLRSLCQAGGESVAA